MTTLKRLAFVNYKNPFKILFFLFLIFYLVFYGPYGLEDGDMGTVFSISWSMYNGLFPFVDFVYIKPPMSPYFHSLPLYISEDYAYLINRFGYYVQVFLYCLLAGKMLCRAFEIKDEKTIYFISLLGALITIHNYPPTPWNTVDGVFFCVLGLWFLYYRKNNLINWILGALFISLGALCKQSFFFFPVFLTGYLLIQKEYKKVAVFITSGITFAGIFLFVLWTQNALSPFFEQLFSFTPGSSLVDTGIKVYYLALKFNLIWILLFLGGFVVVRKFKPNNISFLYFSLILAGIFLFLYLQPDSFYTVKKSLIQILFVIASLYTISRIKSTAHQFLLLLLSLSWCAAISNGFNTPIHFSLPIVFSFFLMSFKSVAFFKKTTGYFVIALFAIVFFVGYQNVYMDSKRPELNYDIGTVFPQLKFVKSDKETFDKYSELKQLSKDYSNFTILPSVTLGHYLTNTINPIGVDWVFNHHLADKIPAYIKKLEDKNVTVFLENFENNVNEYEETSDLTMYVKETWEMIEQREHFRVFRKPKPSQK